MIEIAITYFMVELVMRIQDFKPKVAALNFTQDSKHYKIFCRNRLTEESLIRVVGLFFTDTFTYIRFPVTFKMSSFL